MFPYQLRLKAIPIDNVYMILPTNNIDHNKRIHPSCVATYQEAQATTTNDKKVFDVIAILLKKKYFLFFPGKYPFIGYKQLLQEC